MVTPNEAVWLPQLKTQCREQKRRKTHSKARERRKASGLIVLRVEIALTSHFALDGSSIFIDCT